MNQQILPWRRNGNGVVIRIRLTPRSSRSAIVGVGETAEGLAVLVRVNAVPQNQAANTALSDLIADWLQCPKRDVELAAGAKSRIKSVAIHGDPDELGRRLKERLATLGAVDPWSGRSDAE